MGSAMKSLGRIVGKWLWRWRYRLPALLLAVAALYSVGVPALLGPVTPVERVVRADFVQSVVASGHVEAPFRVNIGSQVTGIVADVTVSEGQAVKAGDTLIVLDDREARAAVIQAEGAVAQAEARLRQIRELTLTNAAQRAEVVRKVAAEVERLHEAVRAVLAKGIEQRGSTLGDSVLQNYLPPSGRPGRAQEGHQVFRRTGMPCPVCGTPIARIVVAQRSTHFCPVCQGGELAIGSGE